MKKEKLVGLMVVFLCITVVLMGCSTDMDESTALPEESDSEKVPDLTGMKAVFLIANGFHDAETTNPIAYLNRHGVECTLIGPEVGEVGAYNSKVMLEIEKRSKKLR